MFQKAPIRLIILLSLLFPLASCISASSAHPSPTTHLTPSISLASWLTFDGGSSRMGVNTLEHTITQSNVSQLTRLWQTQLPNTADSSPLFLPNVPTINGPKSLLFLTTLNGSLLAIDAATGQLVWSKETQGPKITNSSPALDSTGHFVYSYGLDGKVHKYAVNNGAEVLDAHWPVTVTLMNQDEKESSALNITNDYLYVTISGYNGDAGHYEGHVVAIQLATGNATIFNSLCSNIRQLLVNTPTAANYCPDVQSGIWARAGAVVDPVTGNVFAATGNGLYTANNGGNDYGDSVLELSPDLSHLIDSYTPANYTDLDQNDLDLGSASPVMLPKQTASNTPYLAVQAGKDEKLRLLNRQNLSGQGGPNHVGGELQSLDLPQGCGVLTQPATWNDANGVTWVFVANDCGLSALKVITNVQGQTSLQVAYTSQLSGSSPFIANNILFLQGDQVLRALDPSTGGTLWSSTNPSAGGSIGGLHWESPLVVNGVVYASDENGALTAYGLLPR